MSMWTELDFFTAINSTIIIGVINLYKGTIAYFVSDTQHIF